MFYGRVNARRTLTGLGSGKGKNKGETGMNL